MSVTLIILQRSSFSFLLLDIMSFTFTVFGRWECMGIQSSWTFFLSFFLSFLPSKKVKQKLFSHTWMCHLVQTTLLDISTDPNHGIYVWMRDGWKWAAMGRNSGGPHKSRLAHLCPPYKCNNVCLWIKSGTLSDTIARSFLAVEETLWLCVSEKWAAALTTAGYRG